MSSNTRAAASGSGRLPSLQITLTIPGEYLEGLAASPDKAGDEIRMLAAVKLFELEQFRPGRRGGPGFPVSSFSNNWVPTVFPGST